MTIKKVNSKYDYAKNETFKDKVFYYFFKAALDVSNELSINHIFNNDNARNNYFSDNPGELIDGRICKSGELYQIYSTDTETWSDEFPYEQRLLFSAYILFGNANRYYLAESVIVNPTIALKVESGENYESDLEYVVNSNFNSFACLGNIAGIL